MYLFIWIPSVDRVFGIGTRLYEMDYRAHPLR